LPQQYPLLTTADVHVDRSPSRGPRVSAAGEPALLVDVVAASAELEFEWSGLVLETQSAGLFVSPLWATNYGRHRKRAGVVRCYVVGRTRTGRLVGIVPMVRGFGSFRASCAAGEYESDWCCDPSYARAFLTRAAGALSRQSRWWLYIALNVIRESSPLLAAVRELQRDGQVRCQFRPGYDIPYLITDRAGADALDIPDRKYRGELRRRRRKLEEMGKLRFQEVRDLTGLDAALEQFIRVEASGWKTRAGSAIASEPDAWEFWRHLAHAAASAGVLRLHLLWLNDQVVSGQLGIVWGDRYHCLKLGFDEQYRTLGPGALMTLHAIQTCLDDPAIRVYDFAGPRQAYMLNWTDRYVQTWNVWLAGPGLVRGSLFSAIVATRGALRVLRKAVRARWRGEVFPESSAIRC